MGVYLNKIELGEIQPCCNECGVPLCWSIEIEEYLSYKPFWDGWQCEYCNPEYRGKYKIYQDENEPYKWLNKDTVTELKEFLSHV